MWNGLESLDRRALRPVVPASTVNMLKSLPVKMYRAAIDIYVKEVEMKSNRSLYLDQHENRLGPETGWCSRQNCSISLSRDGAWYVGPLHANQGAPVEGCARTLRYAMKAGRSGEAWLESLRVLVLSDSGKLLAQLNLPDGLAENRPRELNVQSLHLPLQCKLRLLFKTPRQDKKAAMRSVDKRIETWLALAA
jgi:hypothetical protein